MSLTTLPNGTAEERTVTVLQSVKHQVFTLAVNVLVLTELCIAMYFAAHAQDRLTEVFFTCFLGMLVPTIFMAAIAKRLLLPRLR